MQLNKLKDRHFTQTYQDWVFLYSVEIWVEGLQFFYYFWYAGNQKNTKMNVKLKDSEKIKILNSDDIYSVMQRVLLREDKIDQDREGTKFVSKDAIIYRPIEGDVYIDPVTGVKKQVNQNQ